MYIKTARLWILLYFQVQPQKEYVSLSKSSLLCLPLLGFALVLKQSQINSMLCYLNVCLTVTVGPVIILADFIIDISAKSNTPITKYMKTKYNFDQYVNEYTTKYQTMIDLLFSNHPHQTVSSIYCYWSDHNIIYTVINDQ